MDRLRRLDALFAERVLGCKPKPGRSGGYDCGCTKEPHHFSLNYEIGGDPFHDKGNLAEYTRSLDAAWEGVVKIGDVRIDGPLNGNYDAQVWDAKFTTGHGKADHPAEALVLACLRAVGVTEEELK